MSDELQIRHGMCPEGPLPFAKASRTKVGKIGVALNSNQWASALQRLHVTLVRCSRISSCLAAWSAAFIVAFAKARQVQPAKHRLPESKEASSWLFSARDQFSAASSRSSHCFRPVEDNDGRSLVFGLNTPVTTAQHDLDSHQKEPEAAVMKDAETAKEVANGSVDARDTSSKAKLNDNDSSDKTSRPGSIDKKRERTTDSASGEIRSDSEAETVVLPGKEHGSPSPRRAIKHEGNGESKRSDDQDEDPSAAKDHDNDALGSMSSPRRKKMLKEHTATSSNLSSAKSSPAPEVRNSVGPDQESSLSKAKLQPDSDSHAKSSASRKRKIQSEDADDKGNKRRQRRDGSLEGTTNHLPSERDRRDNRKASSARSESPQPRTRNRAHSIKSTLQSGLQKKRKPPPLQVNPPRVKDEADGSSDGSNSPAGQANLRRLVSVDSSAMSPAKMPHKKLKDKSGRTFLARACDGEDVEAVRSRLKERPEDLDVADYAGNTPLQIAALAGSADIVKVLLDAGCNLDCKNVDQDTPLIDAVENGHLDVIKLLLKAGLDPRQSNAKGEELLDLLNSDNDNYHETREVLINARDNRRRPSEDQSGLTSSTRESAQGHRGSNLNSPPPLVSASSASRRRTARSEATRNDLLWVNATAENLREKAKIGDNAAVDHILNMRPIADIPAVLAAARGAHEIALQLLIAIGKPEHDPDPLPGTKNGQGTPMLAAIGRGSTRVIELLLEQTGFDPSRRLYKNMAYFEISKERRGPNWEQEHKILKRAYDKHEGSASNGTSPSSKRESQATKDSKRPKSEALGSLSRGTTKPSSPEQSRDGSLRKKQHMDSRNPQTRREKERNSPERTRDLSKKHLRVPSKPSSREHSIAVSDREASPFAISKEKKIKRSLSEAEVPDKDAPKPRKRLISGRALKDDEEKKRRASMVSVASSASSQEHPKSRDSRGPPQTKVKREGSREGSKSGLEPLKKRRRPSPSPSEGHSSILSRSPDAGKRAKRLRVDADGKIKRRADSDGGVSKGGSPVPQTSSHGLAAKSLNASQSGSAAPVAFMGAAKSPQSKESAKGGASRAGSTPSTLERRKLSSKTASPKDVSAADSHKAQDHKEDKEREEMANQLQGEVQAALELEQSQKKEKAMLEEKEKERVARENADRLAREAEEAQAEEKRLAEEAERKAKAEREEEEAKQEKERKELEAEQERLRQEEAARLAKKREEEEQARALAEQERLRKAEEERQVQKRLEQEERERLARIRKQEEEERRRREALPNALRIVAELGPEQARQQSEVRHWLPLYTTKGRQLDPTCEEQAQEELWITNLQAAPVFGLADLDLSQYTAWTKRNATESERFSLWRVLRRKLTRYEPPLLGPVDYSVEFRMDTEAHEKYSALNNVFWIKLSDLQDVAPRYPHLAGLDLKYSPMAHNSAEPAKQPPKINGHSGLLTNGVPPNGSLSNGYH